ncbi:unnamed protein product [Parnassius mnemosyne]|uniref:S-adenosylmethionine sensor upstream of mTORC1 n=1 Tax=Parnassius mnemosyne TaxID=213953 RepID=A0AAV1LEA7_9NEOP
MANEEHKLLAQYIKEVHAALRKASYKIGVQKAWQEHCKNEKVLSVYAKCMEQLATKHWESNCAVNTNEIVSRIDWSADFCYSYYVNNYYLKFHEKELDISDKINITLKTMESFSLPLKLLDVGSCYNPFNKYGFFDVLAIDLCPANNSVLKCDFLNVMIGNKLIIEAHEVYQLQQNYFDIVTFCFLLEYIPNSELRIEACKRAYCVLKPGGLLIINTPDSKHVGANSKLMKCWRYTLACLGFSRIKYEKFKHMHCLAFRRSLDKEIPRRWVTLYKEPFMEFSLNIPQDFLCDGEDKNISEYSTCTNCVADMELFGELPFNLNCDA